MGANNGTGYPCWLNCRRCRGVEGRLHGRKGNDLEATGRTRPIRGRKGGYRCTNRSIEYRCRECGYTGWTKHMDAERLINRLAERNER